MDKKFVTAINSIDGRAQEPVINYLKKKFNVDYVDMITEPGPNKILSDNLARAIVDSIKEQVSISVAHHGSKHIAVVAYYGCVGNPADENDQKQHLRNAVNLIKEWNFPVETVEALWLDESFEVVEVA
jgi:uncharacterized protein YlxP (DUF503 family)